MILGGTGRMSHLLREICLKNGDDVTIATRGRHRLNCSEKIKVLTFDRYDENKTKQWLDGKSYDVVFDCSGYAPQCVDWVLSTISVNRYVYVSSIEVYAYYYSGNKLAESCLPIDIPIDEENVVSGSNSWYARGKRNSELLISNKYPNLNYVIVRIPFVMSKGDDYIDSFSNRLLQYVSKVHKNEAINEKNLDCNYCFAESEDEAKFLYFLSNSNYKGVVNFSSDGSISMREVIAYLERKTGEKAMFDKDSEKLPFTDYPEVTLDISRCKEIGYEPIKLREWLFNKIDKYIEYLSRQF